MHVINYPIKLINNSDETVHYETLPLSRGRSIADGRSRWSHVDARYKTPWNRHHWITIRRIRCVSSQFNLDRYNSCDQRSRLNRSSEPRFKLRVFIWFKWRSTVDISRAIGRPTRRLLIAIVDCDWSDGSDCAMSPARFKYSEKSILNYKKIFSSGKSLEIH